MKKRDKLHPPQFGRAAQFGERGPPAKPAPYPSISRPLAASPPSLVPRDPSLTSTRGRCGRGCASPGDRAPSSWCRRSCCRAARLAAVVGGVPRRSRGGRLYRPPRWAAGGRDWRRASPRPEAAAAARLWHACAAGARAAAEPREVGCAARRARSGPTVQSVRFASLYRMYVWQCGRRARASVG